MADSTKTREPYVGDDHDFAYESAASLALDPVDTRVIEADAPARYIGESLEQYEARIRLVQRI